MSHPRSARHVRASRSHARASTPLDVGLETGNAVVMAISGDGLPLPRVVDVSRTRARAGATVELGAPRASLHVCLRGRLTLPEGELGARAIAWIAGGATLRGRADAPARADIVSAELDGARASVEDAVVLPSLAELPAVDHVLAALESDLASGGRASRPLLDALVALVAPALGAAALDPRIARAAAAMTRDPSRRWTVASLARAAGLSRSAFARRFQSELGAGPIEWLTSLRMRLAAERLARTDEGLAAIGAAVGYESEFAFARAFKRAFGVPPGVHRRLARRVAGPSTFRAAA